MAEVEFDPTARRLVLDLTKNEYKQSISISQHGLVNRQRRLVGIQNGENGLITLTYFDTHTLQTITKIVQNKDAQGNPKPSAPRVISNNAQKIKNWRGEASYHILTDEEKAKLTVVEEPETDLAWKSDVRYYGLREALLGNVPMLGKTSY
jgi:hypothetical protein